MPSILAKLGRTLLTKASYPANEGRETRKATASAPRCHASFGGTQKGPTNTAKPGWTSHTKASNPGSAGRENLQNQKGNLSRS